MECVVLFNKNGMSGYLLRLLLWFFIVLPGSQMAWAVSLAEQRQYYNKAKAALARGDSKPYQQYAKALADYPLLPHLAYDELTNRLKYASNEEVEAFLAANADLPQINWMKLRWLRWLAERGQWKTFVKYYDEKLNFAELDCLHARYLLSLRDKKAGFAATEKLWLVGRSQHESCDTLFVLWRKMGGMREAQIWQRAVLATEAGNYSLARYLAHDLTTLKKEAALLVEVAQKPRTVIQTGRFANTTGAMGDVVALGLRRLLREDTEKALALLEQYSKKQRFFEATRLDLARTFGLTLAKRFDPRALDILNKYAPGLADDDISEWRIRLLLRLGRFAEAHQYIKYLPEKLASSSRWRYWRARSLQLAQPDNQESAELYRVLAEGRGFYEFMAADLLGLPMQLNHRPLPGEAQALKKVQTRAAVKRALEFFARGEENAAWQEWYNAVAYLPQAEQVALARLAYQRQWYFQTIRTLALAEYWDDLELRFPLPWQRELKQVASERKLHPSWVFAIARQESAFRLDAKSSAGALGLMQLMPKTARETARRFDIALKNNRDILIPTTNIVLGTAYLAQLQEQFGGSRVLASAAYNAGPSRVSSWLQNADHLPWDIWVESIPFNETRQYVQNVLSYAFIYSHRLGMPQPFLAEYEHRLNTD